MVRIQGGSRVQESTTVLIHRIWDGDLAAREQLARAYLPILKRIAHGRLPARARGLLDTDDLVTDSLARAFEKIERFEPRREGAFLSYLYQILLNRIRDEIRRARVRPEAVPIDEDLPGNGRSPEDELIARMARERYERACELLSDVHREVVILRLEMGLSHSQVAEAVGLPSADAARMCYARALAHIASAMGPGEP